MEDYYQSFRVKLEGVSGECYRVATAAEGIELATHVLQSKGVKSVALAGFFLSEAGGLASKLAQAGITVHTENLRAAAPEADAGITIGRWAIAETGTIVQTATDVDERLCSTLPPLHLVLLSTDALVPTLAEALKRIHSSPEIPGFVGFITGPSRTSDIERVLTIGVHGPEQFIAVFVEGEVE
ncbi:LutC/YkgG family protein [Paradesulfitobacterium ferrireducens]|uniref:LutC/YkgG family protein n=1 Tax=Paradesulfitobacterium ferrireducens TaxID=2816476 RepID=UPI001A8CB282|nr:lactate utilization protein [Paradesulfitobacterium ferrireducens]